MQCHVAEGLGRGPQNLLWRFDSVRGVNNVRVFFGVRKGLLIILSNPFLFEKTGKECGLLFCCKCFQVFDDCRETSHPKRQVFSVLQQMHQVLLGLYIHSV